MKLITLSTEKDFAKVAHLPFNREFSVRQDLINSMNEFGFTVPIQLLSTNIMDGKKRLWLLDGQHRMITAQFLELPVLAFVMENDRIKTKEDLVRYVANLNSKSKQWRMMNYVEAYNYLGYPEYEKLIKLTNSVPYSANTVATLLSGNRGKGLKTRAVQEGRFKIHDYDGTIECLKYSKELGKFQKLTSRMLIALKLVMGLKHFDPVVFAEMYRRNAKLVKDMNLDDYSEMFMSWIKK